MDVSAPHRILHSTVDIDVLRALAGVDAALTGRRVSELVHGGHSGTVHRSLERLTRLGLLLAQRAGRATLYRFNREHVAAEAVMAFITLRTTMIAELREAVARLDPPPLAAVLFGSAARGDGGPESDLDLAIIRDTHDDASGGSDWDAQIDAMAVALERRFGNAISVHELSPANAARLAETRSPTVAEILADQVPLCGRPIADFFAATDTR